MKFYLAASWGRQAEMREVREELSKDHSVTSRWIDLDPATENWTPEEFATAAIPHAQDDLEDIDAADAVLLFLGRASARGGRHVEMGYALGRGISVYVVSEGRSHENIFQTLLAPIAQTWQEAVAMAEQDWEDAEKLDLIRGALPDPED